MRNPWIVFVLFGALGCGGGSEEPASSAEAAESTSGGTAQAAPAGVDPATNGGEIGLPNERHPREGLVTGGAPDDEQLARAKTHGVTRVISLQVPDETAATQEQFTVESLGMEFVRIPVQGASGLTKDNAQELHQTLGQTQEGTVLLHCASGNRAGALLALRAFYFEDKSVEEAMELGRSAGMTELEPAVREHLEQACESDPDRC